MPSRTCPPATALKVGLILAKADNEVIGRGNALPWHLPEDLARFRDLTTGHAVLMGRRTWESLPTSVRPLPGRTNLVATRQSGWGAAGAWPVRGLDEAIALCAGAPRLWVIGGVTLFEQALPLADVIELTQVHAHFEGDVFAPDFGPGWVEVWRATHTTAYGLDFSFVRLQRAHTHD